MQAPPAYSPRLLEKTAGLCPDANRLARSASCPCERPADGCCTALGRRPQGAVVQSHGSCRPRRTLSLLKAAWRLPFPACSMVARPALACTPTLARHSPVHRRGLPGRLDRTPLAAVPPAWRS